MNCSRWIWSNWIVVRWIVTVFNCQWVEVLPIYYLCLELSRRISPSWIVTKQNVNKLSQKINFLRKIVRYELSRIELWKKTIRRKTVTKWVIAMLIYHRHRPFQKNSRWIIINNFLDELSTGSTEMNYCKMKWGNDIKFFNE